MQLHTGSFSLFKKYKKSKNKVNINFTNMLLTVKFDWFYDFVFVFIELKLFWLDKVYLEKEEKAK